LTACLLHKRGVKLSRRRLITNKCM
jgi:hypothetical protein